MEERKEQRGEKQSKSGEVLRGKNDSCFVYYNFSFCPIPSSYCHKTSIRGGVLFRERVTDLNLGIWGNSKKERKEKKE